MLSINYENTTENTSLENKLLSIKNRVAHASAIFALIGAVREDFGSLRDSEDQVKDHRELLMNLSDVGELGQAIIDGLGYQVEELFNETSLSNVISFEGRDAA